MPVTGEPVRDALRCRPDAAYLITGGLGALGLLTAGWLADRGARRVWCLPDGHRYRRGGTGTATSTIAWQAHRDHRDPRARERRGVSVEMVILDIGSSDDVQALLAPRDREGAPADSRVVHAAGVTGDQLVTSITDDVAAAGNVAENRWRAGVAPLHSRCGSLDFFFLMASAASVFGIPGQGSYAAANCLPRRAGPRPAPPRLPYRQPRLGGMARTRVRLRRADRDQELAANRFPGVDYPTRRSPPGITCTAAT